MSALAPPQIWIVRLQGNNVVKQSYRDDSFEYTTYELIDRDFNYLSSEQIKTMKWLLEQSYPVAVDVGRKAIARETSHQTDQVIENLNQVATNDFEPPAWVGAIQDVNEYARDLFDSFGDRNHDSSREFAGF